MPDNAELLLLDRDAVATLLTPEEVAKAVHESFVLHSARKGRVFPVVREALPGGGIFGIKSGDVPSSSLLGFKAAGFWPQNRAVAGEPHQATVALFDPATGRPLCIMDGNAITTARTAAAGELGLRALARPDSTSLCVFGPGVQGQAQLRAALRALRSVQHIWYVTFNGERDHAFERLFESECQITLARDPDVAVSESDVVITAPLEGASSSVRKLSGQERTLIALEPTHAGSVSCLMGYCRGRVWLLTTISKPQASVKCNGLRRSRTSSSVTS